MSDFNSKFVVDEETGCHMWTAGKNDQGYGYFAVKTVMVRAHRFAYERANGPIPEGLVIDHLCEVKACVNPDHLFLGSNADNTADMVKKGRAKSVVSIGEANGRARLTDAQVIEIRALSGSILQREIPGRCGVSQAHVSGILSCQRR